MRERSKYFDEIFRSVARVYMEKTSLPNNKCHWPSSTFLAAAAARGQRGNGELGGLDHTAGDLPVVIAAVFSHSRHKLVLFPGILSHCARIQDGALLAVAFPSALHCSRTIHSLSQRSETMYIRFVYYHGAISAAVVASGVLLLRMPPLMELKSTAVMFSIY